MDAKQFRLGNFVDLYGNTASICSDDFNPESSGIAIVAGKPIPLTEAWLIRNGFSEPDNDKPYKCKWFELGCIRIVVDVMGFRVCIKSMPLGKTSLLLRPILYVHQLQNIYFDLTELELNVR